MSDKGNSGEAKNPYRVEANKWYNYPRLLSGQRQRFSPQGNPISWRGPAGLAGLIVEIRNQLGPGRHFRMAELGSFNGESAAIFAGSGMFEKLWLIDKWNNPQCYGLCEYNMRPFGQRVEMIKGNIDEVVQSWNEELDCIYVDADHGYDSVKRNLRDWYPFIKYGGVVTGHDYNPKAHPNVVRAIDEFFEGKEVTTFLDSSWLVVKEK